MGIQLSKGEGSWYLLSGAENEVLRGEAGGCKWRVGKTANPYGTGE